MRDKVVIIHLIAAAAVANMVGLSTIAEPAAVATRQAASPATDETVVRGELGADLDEYLTRLAGFGYGGAALVAEGGEIVLQKGFGLADREAKRPVTPNTVFTIGSITKQFTGAAVLTLEMAGKLSVDAEISDYFDNVPPDKQQITIHHLLTHTAGFPGAIGDDFSCASLFRSRRLSRLRT